MGSAGQVSRLSLLEALLLVSAWTGAARPGSVVAAADRAHALLVTAFLAAIVATGVLLGHDGSVGTPEELGAVIATALLVALMLTDVMRAIRVTRLTRGLVRVPVLDQNRVPAQCEVDLGVGEERWVSLDATWRGAPYRDRAVDRGVRGSVGETRRRLTGTVLVDLAWLAGWLVLSAAIVMPVRHHGCGFDRTESTARALRGIAESWRGEHPDESCPTVGLLVREGAIDRAAARTDPWGTPLVIACEDDETYVYSRGPDRRDDHGFGDDVRVPARRTWQAPSVTARFRDRVRCLK